jgi:hypothetical protein
LLTPSLKNATAGHFLKANSQGLGCRLMIKNLPNMAQGSDPCIGKKSKIKFVNVRM